MPEFDQKEYQTVILGALLHDVGKFWRRTARSGTHAEASAAFIDQFIKPVSQESKFDGTMLQHVIEGWR